jgi:hypothetical protein
LLWTYSQEFWRCGAFEAKRRSHAEKGNCLVAVLICCGYQ